MQYIAFYVSVYFCFVRVSEDDKDSFYSQLSGILDKLRNRDINIVMGDFNTKICKDNKGFEQFMEQYGLGEMNKNGEQFAYICGTKNLVIGRSISKTREYTRLHGYHQTMWLRTSLTPSVSQRAFNSRCWMSKLREEQMTL